MPAKPDVVMSWPEFFRFALCVSGLAGFVLLYLHLSQ
jgi:hypothetical protein